MVVDKFKVEKCTTVGALGYGKYFCEKVDAEEYSCGVGKTPEVALLNLLGTSKEAEEYMVRTTTEKYEYIFTKLRYEVADLLSEGED